MASLATAVLINRTLIIPDVGAISYTGQVYTWRWDRMFDFKRMRVSGPRDAYDQLK